MKDSINELLERRSIRSYEEKQITDEQLSAILEAGKSAPSGMNQHKWKLVVFRNGGALETLISEMKNSPFYGAPTVIAVFVDKASCTPVQDGSLALGNMMNAAHMLGLGSCWVNSPAPFFDTDAGKKLKATYHIPSDYFCVGSCAIGYVKGEYPKRRSMPDDLVILTD